MTVGLILHLDDPTATDVRAAARAAEEAGADWLGIPDAFWWRDTWVLAAEAVGVTSRLQVGPVVTNPYLRHPFHTVAAVATLQELAGPRILVGIGAGGSELAGAAGVDRRDAPARTEALAALIRSVAAGAPLDPGSGRTLDVPLQAPPIVVGGRGPRMLASAGRVADRALLWAVPRSELRTTVDHVLAGARTRDPALPAVGLVWAPIVEHGPRGADLVRRAATYAILNNGPGALDRWGVDDALVGRVRELLVAGRVGDAERAVPDSVAADLRTGDDVRAAAATARSIQASDIALPLTDVATVGDEVDWARRVLAADPAADRSDAGAAVQAGR